MRVPHGSAASIYGEMLCGPLPRIRRSAGYVPDPGPGDLCRRKAVLFYPKGFAQVALTGLLSFRDSMDPNIRWEAVGDSLQHSPLILRVHRGPF